MTQRGVRRLDGVFVLTESSYDSLITTQFKAQSEKSPAISLRGCHVQELQVFKLLEHPGQGLSTNSTCAALCTSSTHPKDESLGCITTPTDKLLQNTSRRNLGPRERHFCCLTSAVMQGDGWKQRKDIFVWGGKQIGFLQLLQKTEQMPPEMHSCPKKWHWELANQAEPHWGLLWKTRYHHIQCQHCSLPRAQPTDETNVVLHEKEVGISPWEAQIFMKNYFWWWQKLKADTRILKKKSQ